MAVYDLNSPKDYLRFFKDIERFKENKQKIEVTKFHPVQTDKQARYIQFMISYWAMKNGETFYDTLHEIQLHICPVPFYTGEKDKRGKDTFKPLSALTTAEASSVIRNFLDYASMNGTPIPEMDDKVGLSYCQKELESADGWI